MIKDKNSFNGFTLLELMIAIAIFGMVVAMIMGSRVQQEGQHITNLQAAEMQQNVRAALFSMKTELLTAGFDNTDNKIFAGQVGITNAGSNTITFVAYDPDLTPTPGLVTTVYSLGDHGSDGDNDILVNQSGSNQLLAENIQNLQFIYYNSSGGQATTPSEIRTVQIIITAGLDAGHRDSIGGQTRVLDTIVCLRNLM